MVTSKITARVFEKIYLDLQQDEIAFSTSDGKPLYYETYLGRSHRKAIKARQT